MSLVAAIWSGGQTGADRGGLDGAIDLGIAIDGYVPLGRRAEDGYVPDHYGLREAGTVDYATRTGLNIESTDITPIFTLGPPERGSFVTAQLAQTMGKPHPTFDLAVLTDLEAARRLRERVASLAAELGREVIVNVAGNRESVAPGIGLRVRRIIRIAFDGAPIDVRTIVVNLRTDAYDVYIGRRGHGHDGYFGNPHPVDESCPICGFTHRRGEAIAAFDQSLLARADTDLEYRRRLARLRGKKLGCFCVPLACHGHSIARWLDGDVGIDATVVPIIQHAHHAAAIERGADCTRCALYGCGRGPIPSQIVPNALMAIGGEAGGKFEVIWGRNFVGESGKILDASLWEGSQPRDDQTVINCIGCQPTPPYSMEEFLARAQKRAEREWTGKKIKEIAERRAAGEEISKEQETEELAVFEWTSNPILRCRGRFERDLDETNPRVFLAVGKYALAEMERYLRSRGLLDDETDDIAMSKVHGAPILLKDGRFLFASYHPAFAMHDGVEDERGEREPSKWMKFIRANITTAAAVATRGWINWSEPAYLIAPPVATAVAWLRWVRSTGAELNFDLETCDPITGRPSADQYSCDIRTIGSGVTVDGREYVMVVPFRHMDGEPWEYTNEERALLFAEFKETFDTLPLAAYNGYAFDTEVLLTDRRGPERAVVAVYEDAIALVRKRFAQVHKAKIKAATKRKPKKRKKETDDAFAVRMTEWLHAVPEHGTCGATIGGECAADGSVDTEVAAFVARRLSFCAPRLLSDRLRKITDVMLVWADTPDGDMPKALSFSARATFEVPAWKAKEDIASTDNADDPKCMLRCARDVVVPMRALPIWRSTIEAIGATPQYKLDESLGRVERDIGSLGMCIDERARGFWSHVLGRESGKLRTKWDALVGREVNPQSVPQLRELFYSARGWDLDPPLTVEGKEWDEDKDDEEDGSTGAPAILALLEQPQHLDKRQVAALETILEYKVLAKQKSTYIDNAPVRRWPGEGAIVLPSQGSLPPRPVISWLRPTNSMGRTPVARSAARKSAEQQRPKLGRRIYLDDDIEVPDSLIKRIKVENGQRSIIANMRTIIIPAPGHEFSGADYAQSHLRIYAAQAQDALLYWAFENKDPRGEPINAHGLNMATFLADPRDEGALWREYEKIMYLCSKDEKEYWLFVPKRGAFAFIYGAFPKKVFQTMHAERKRETGMRAFPDITLGDCETWYGRWHDRHPETRPWQDDAYAFYAEYNYIASPILDQRQRHGPGLDANQIPNHRVLAMEGSLHKRAIEQLDELLPHKGESEWSGVMYDGHDSIIAQSLIGTGARVRNQVQDAMMYEWRNMKFYGKAKALPTAGDL